MTTFVPFDRDQPFLLPPDLKDWLPEDDIAHFVVAAVERVRLGAFRTNPQAGGKPQYHPRLMLALLVYCYANGIFSSRRIERATWRDIGARFIAANTHPDHDTIASFRRANRAAFEAAFVEVLLLARESGLLRLGTVSIDGSKIDADASKIRSVRYDRAQALREKLAADIAALTAQAETADAEDADPQALPAAIARREALKAKLDAACARLEAEAAAQAEAERPAYQEKQAAWQAKKGRRGRPPKPPDATPPTARQSNLTDPDSQLMRRSKAHEYRQAYNAQAVVCAEGTQLILATNLTANPSDAPSFAATILAMEKTVGLPRVVLADAGFATKSRGDDSLRLFQVQQLLAWVDSRPDAAASIVCGDFNATVDMPSAARMASRFQPTQTITPTAFTPLSDNDRTISHPYWPRMDRCIDYIWVSEAIEVVASEVCLNRPASDDPTLWPSDHAGVWADLSLSAAVPVAAKRS
jgi:transposase